MEKVFENKIVVKFPKHTVKSRQCSEMFVKTMNNFEILDESIEKVATTNQFSNQSLEHLKGANPECKVHDSKENPPQHCPRRPDFR